MIVTVTANTTLDHVLFIPSYEQNTTIRATKVVQSMGGKPTDTSLILGTMGMTSLALGFVAGLTGRAVEQMLHQKGVQTDFIQVNGESRRTIVIICEDQPGHTTITASTLEVDEVAVNTLKQHFAKTLEDADVVTLGGTLPHGMAPDFYFDVIQMARQRKVPVIFDASEPYFSAGLAAGPTYVKPNHDELTAFTGHPLETIEDIYRAGKDLQESYDTSPIMSLGSEGGLAILPDCTYYIPAIKVDVINAAGAGDAILAGLSAAIAKGQPIEEGLRLGFAAATAVVTTPGTAQCCMEDIEHYLPQIELIPWSKL